MDNSDAARAPEHLKALFNKISLKGFGQTRSVRLLSLAIIGASLVGISACQVRAQPAVDSIFIRDHSQPLTWGDLSTRCVLTEEDRDYTKRTPCKITSLGAFSTAVSKQGQWATVSVAIQMQNWNDLGQAPRNHFTIFEGDAERKNFRPIDVSYDFTDEHIEYSGIQFGILGQFLVVTGHAGVHGYGYNVFRRGESAWKTIDTKSWFNEVQEKLPQGWWTPEPVLLDFGTGFALLELHRPNDSYAIATGGTAIVQLAIRGNRFVVTKMTATTTRFN
jgi:hypothetical protein